MSEEIKAETTETTPVEPTAAPVKKKRGRPLGSTNKPKDPNAPKKEKAPKAPKAAKAPKEKKAKAAKSTTTSETVKTVDSSTVKVVIQAEPELSDDIVAEETNVNE